MFYYRVTSSIGRLPVWVKIHLKTVVLAQSFVFQHRTKLLKLVTAIPQKQLFISSRIILR